MPQHIKYNVHKLYIIKIAKWFMLVMPIVVLFYEQNGLSAFHVFTLQAVYSISIVAFEIPSGYLADVIGRKKSLIFGAVLGFAGYAVYSFSFGFTGFLIAEIVLGIGQSMISGADSALLYDTLLDQKRDQEYIKQEGRITSMGNFAEAIAGITGGLLATISLRLPYIAQTAIAFMAIPAALSLIEPIRHAALKEIKLKDILYIFNDVLVKNKPLRYNIVFSSVIGTATLTMAWFAQFYFEAIKLPVAWFGIIWTALNLTVALTSLFAHRVEMYLGQIKTVLLIILGTGCSYIILGSYQNYWGLAILFLFYMIRGIATPVLKDYINKMTRSEIRATVLSIRSFAIRLLFAGIGPILGYMTGHYSLKLALLLAGFFFLFVCLISFFLFFRIIKLKQVA